MDATMELVQPYVVGNHGIYSKGHSINLRTAFIKVFGVETGVLLSYLMEYETKLQEIGELSKEGYFPEGFEYIQFLEDVGFTPEQIDNGLKTLFDKTALLLDVLTMRIRINYDRLFRAVADYE